MAKKKLPPWLEKDEKDPKKGKPETKAEKDEKKTKKKNPFSKKGK